jgi:hypothetical protein
VCYREAVNGTSVHGYDESETFDGGHRILPGCRIAVWSVAADLGIER